MLGLASSNPATSLQTTVLFALAVAFFSATQDIIIDAFRIETFETDEQALSAATYTYGYRIGMLISGGVALKLSEYVSWHGVYVFLTATIGFGLVATLIAQTPKIITKQHKINFTAKGLAKQIFFFALFTFAVALNIPSVIQLFSNFGGGISPTTNGIFMLVSIVIFFIASALVTKHGINADFTKHKGWVLLLIFVVVYKFPAAFLGGGIMSNFYLKMGFSKDEIFLAVKVFGMGATIIGLAIGGIVAAKWGLVRALWVDAILQASTNLLFIPLVYTSQNVALLSVAVAAENIASAMGSVVLVAFISKLCNREFSATQYALLSSLAANGRTLLAANSGWIVASMGWGQFFFITFLSGIPALILIPFIRKFMTNTADEKS